MARRTIEVVFLGDERRLVRSFKAVDAAASKTQSAVGGKMSKLRGHLQTIGIGLLGVGVAAGAMGLKFVKAAEESNKVGAQTGAVLKSTGGAANVTAGAVGKLADALSAKAGIDDEAIQSGENVLLTFRNVRNEVGKGNDIFTQGTKAALDMSVAMGTELKSANVQLGKALNDPIKGITALRRVGVTFSQGQIDMIKHLTETGDRLGAQKIILAELKKEFAGSAEAQATASGKLGVAWENLQETLGKKLLPIVNKFSEWATKTGIPAIEALTNWFSKHQGVAKALAAIVGGILVAAFVAWGVSVIAATWPIILIGVVVGGLAILVVKHSATIKKAFATAFDWLKRNWPLLVGILTGPIGLAVVMIMRHWRAMWTSLQGVWSSILGFFKAMPGRIVGALGNLGRLLWGTGVAIITGLKNGAGKAWEDVKGWIRGIPGAIVNIFRAPGLVLWNIGKAIIRGMWNGIKAAWNDVIGWVKDIPSKILHALGIHSPPEWAIKAGKEIMKGVLKGIGATAKNLLGSLKGLVSGNLGGAATSVIQKLGQQMAAAYGWTGVQWDALRQLWQNESGWNPNARNPSSGAYGIPQALPPSKMGAAAAAGDAGAQIAWGLGYIKERYGNPLNALSAWMSRSPHWYGGGGMVDAPLGAPVPAVVHGGEGVFTRDQLKAMGGRRQVIEVHSHVYLDGKQIAESVRQVNARNNGRNSIRVR